MRKPKLLLRYIGDGSFIPGLPPRDLTEVDVKKYALIDLLTSGLYEEIKTEPTKAAKQEVEQWQESEN